MEDAPDRLRRIVIDAAREFNAGRYFEAHERLEEGLDEVPDDLWDLFLGLIQVAVGYHKVTQELWSGSVRMLELGLEKLSSYPPAGGGLHLAALRRRVVEDVERIRSQRFDADAFSRDPPRLQPFAKAE